MNQMCQLVIRSSDILEDMFSESDVPSSKAIEVGMVVADTVWSAPQKKWKRFRELWHEGTCMMHDAAVQDPPIPVLGSDRAASSAEHCKASDKRYVSQ